MSDQKTNTVKKVTFGKFHTSKRLEKKQNYVRKDQGFKMCLFPINFAFFSIPSISKNPSFSKKVYHFHSADDPV